MAASGGFVSALLAKSDEGVQGAGHVIRDGVCYSVRRIRLGQPGDPSAARLRGQALRLAQSKPSGLPTIRSLSLYETHAEVAMDDRQGDSLREYVMHARLSIDDAKALAFGVGRALEQLHELGERHGTVTLDAIVRDEQGAWCFRDYGECFEGEARNRESDQQAGSTSSGRDLWVDLLGLGQVLEACLATLPGDERDCQKLARLSADLVDPGSAIREHSGVAGFVRELRRAFPELVRTALEEREGIARTEEFEHLARVHAASAGFSTVVLRGSPGTGKTHLIRAFTKTLSPRRVLHATCRNWDVSRFGVVRQLLEGSVSDEGVVISDRLQEVLTLAGDLARFVRPISPVFANAIPAGGRIPEAEASDDVYVEALAEILIRALQREAQVVILDDIQWLDEASRKVLNRAFQREGIDAFLICSTRDDVRDTLQAKRLLDGLDTTIVWDHTLKALDGDAASRVISQYLSVLGIAPDHAQALATLGDGTPLSVIEVVRSVLEAGLLLPNWNTWQPDLAGVAQLRLPTRTTELISKRLHGLQPGTMVVLRIAALLGGEFDVRVVEAATAPATRLESALTDAHQFALVERTAHHAYRFVHQCVRDALIGPLGEPELRELHGRIVRALTKLHGSDLGTMQSTVVFQLAHHVREAADQGELAFSANLEAGRRAIAAFDNRSALVFLTVAESIEGSRQSATSGIGGQIAEAHLRLGDLDASAARFTTELARVRRPEERAHVWSRLATIHEARHDSEQALDCLRQAFDELGEPQAQLGIRSACRLALALLSPNLTRPPARLEAETRAKIEQLCTLYFQMARLSVVGSRTSAILDVAGRCIRAAERLGPSQALSKAYTFKGFLLAAFGRREAATRVTRNALEIARQLDDPPATAHVLINQAAVVCWQGDTNRGLQLGAEAIEQYHNWLIPSESALIVFNQELLETLRGSGREALGLLLKWVSRSLKRDGTDLVSEFLPLRLRAAALHLGADGRHARDVRQFEARCLRVPKGSAYYTWTFGPRVRAFTEVGDLGEAFEHLVKSVEDEHLDPKKVHLVVLEYYIAVAHARVHQCLRSAAPDADHLLALRRAARDLRAAARVPLVVAHAVAVDAYHCLLLQKPKKAEKLFDQAERLGKEHGAPWVLYAAARGRAHLLARRGRMGAAREEALLAERIAREHGAVHRARWIREEFELANPGYAPPVNDADRSRRQLQALGRITRAASSDLDSDRQARLMLDEVIDALQAERGYLFQRRDPGGLHRAPTAMAELRPVASRNANRGDAAATSFAHQAVIERTLKTGSAQVVSSIPPNEVGGTISLLVAPIVVQQTILGVVCLESAPDAPAFTEEDGEVLRALAGQVPMALELAHTLRERERLEEDLRHSQKMEALGRLAGGVAHDFNNMLSAIQVSVDSMLADATANDASRPDLETIQQASDRASRLTRQLLTFSRKESFDAKPLDVNVAVHGVVPMLQRLLGHEIQINVETSPVLHSVKADAMQLEQVLVNLSVNAWDAMRDGGKLTIRTRNVELREGQNAVLPAGDYVVLEVSDDGRGMDEETRRRVFEPFFTTKAAGAGTGLGMAIVYGIVRQNGGHIDVASSVGRGTTITIHLPRGNELDDSRPLVSEVRRASTIRGRVLLVDDEPLVRHSFARVLRKLGCDLSVASTALEAIQILGARPDVDLVITDVVMPDLNGVELIDKLSTMGIRAKVLYVSGFADGVLAQRSGLGDRVEFMSKPVGVRELEEKMRELLSDDGFERAGTGQ